jgi:hypothetical protein
MADTNESWESVGRRATELGRLLKSRFEAAGDGGSDAVKDALRTLRDAFDGVAETVNDAVKDDEVRAQVTDVARSIGDALSSTFRTIGDDVADAFKRRGRPAD